MGTAVEERDAFYWREGRFILPLLGFVGRGNVDRRPWQVFQIGRRGFDGITRERGGVEKVGGLDCACVADPTGS